MQSIFIYEKIAISYCNGHYFCCVTFFCCLNCNLKVKPHEICLVYTELVKDRIFFSEFLWGCIIDSNCLLIYASKILYISPALSFHWNRIVISKKWKSIKQNFIFTWSVFPLLLIYFRCFFIQRADHYYKAVEGLGTI